MSEPRGSKHPNLPAWLVVLALSFAFTVIGVTISATISSQRDSDIQDVAAEAKHVAAQQAQNALDTRKATIIGCVRGELVRQETNLRGDIQRTLWLGAARKRDNDGDHAQAQFYRRQIARQHDVPSLVTGGWKLPIGELRKRAHAACLIAYPPPQQPKKEEQ